MGENVTYEADREQERWIGDRGVFVIRGGSSRGISNSTSPARELPPLLPPEVHDAEAVAYLVASGLDPDQITSVSGSFVVGGDSSDRTEVGFRYTRLTRAWDEIPVLSSTSSVSWNDARRSVSESLFWPEISCQVLDGLHSFARTSRARTRSS